MFHSQLIEQTGGSDGVRDFVYEGIMPFLQCENEYRYFNILVGKRTKSERFRV